MSVDNDFINEDFFPGNQAAYDKATQLITDKRLLIFTGAGTSASLLPTWKPLLTSMAQEAKREGMLTEDELAEFLILADTDPLAAADELERALHSHVFRSRLATIFSGADSRYSDVHKLIISMGPRGLVTLNYDRCLESAYASLHSNSACSLRLCDRSDATRWSQGEVFTSHHMPIMHLHGTPNDPNQMIFTGSDYDRFYSQNEKSEFIREIWKNERMMVIGFGFSDPFLNLVAERALHSLPSDLRHFALIGHTSHQPITAMQRRVFARKYRLDPIFYRIKKSADGHYSDHSGLQVILGSWAKQHTPTPSQTPNPIAPTVSTGHDPVKSPSSVVDFEKGLTYAPNGRALYVEPRIMIPTSDNSKPSMAYSDISLEQIIDSDESFFISALPESGASTLCRRIAKEFFLSGKTHYLAKSSDLPNYRKKLSEHFVGISKHSKPTLILDDFDIDQHERLIKEIISLDIFERYVITSSSRGSSHSYSIDKGRFGLTLNVFTLDNLEITAIRTLSHQMFDTADDNFHSSIVEKVYTDLTDLCVPLTPSNVIMYMTILYKEGDFSPLNHVEIIERYINGLLKRPSDLYSDAFNFRSRIDVISSFIYKLYTASKTSFTDSEWSAFCDEYMEKNIVSFEKRRLLTDLIGSKIISHYRDQYFFRYKLFYSYFLGLYIARKPGLIIRFIESDEFLAIEGIVEIICGVSSDATIIMEKISDRLRESLRDFNSKFAPLNRDPFTMVEWPIRTNDEERVWSPIAAKLAEGPATPSQFDALKRSLLAEKRTEDQQIVIREFSEVERRLIAYQVALIDALRNSDTVSGDVKLEAVRLALESHFVNYQVGLIYAPLIAKHDFFNWNGLVFYNRSPFSDEEKANVARTTFIIMSAMARAVGDQCASNIGMKKLGQVFKVIASKDPPNGFLSYANFCCIIASKSDNWQLAADQVVNNTDRKSFYLKCMMISTYENFFKSINTGSEKDKLKRIVALIKTKRELKKDSPGSKVVGRVLDQLEKRDIFNKD